MILILAVLLLAGTFSTKLTGKLGVPVLLLFLALGMAVGSDGLNLIDFGATVEDKTLAGNIANLALAFILFESGFGTKRSALKKYFGPSLSLATVGIVLTALGLGVLISFLLGIDFKTALLIGSIISSTDAAAVNAILKQRPVREKVASTLQIESAANDPMAILLTLLMINIMNGGTGNPALFTAELIWQFGGGILLGYIMAQVGIFLFRKLNSDNKGYYYVLSAAVVLLIYGVGIETKVSAMLAVFFAGYWMGNSNFIFKRGFSFMIDGMSTLANTIVFLLLGILVFPSQMTTIWKEGLIIAAALIFIVRPLTVWICTAFFKFNWKERTMITWGGVKGAVPIVLATYPSLYLNPDSPYFNETAAIFNIVFFVVAVSCLLQGTTLSSVGKALKLMIPPKPQSFYSVELLTMKETEYDMFEVQLDEASDLEGKKISELPLEQDMLITVIIRKNKMIPPRGGTVLRKEDTLFILAPRNREQELTNYFNNIKHADMDAPALSGSEQN